MWKIILFGIIAFIAIMVIYVIYSSSTDAVVTTSMLSYDGTSLYKTTGPIVYSSNGTDTIYYSTPDGVTAYNVDSKVKTKITSYGMKGLAFDNQTGSLLMLDSSGNLLSYNGVSTNTIGSGYTKLYDTIDAYYQGNDSDYTIFGISKTKNKGDYGMLTFNVVSR